MQTEKNVCDSIFEVDLQHLKCPFSPVFVGTSLLYNILFLTTSICSPPAGLCSHSVQSEESTVSNESGRSLPPGKCSANHAALATVFPGTAKLRSLPFRLFTYGSTILHPLNHVDPEMVVDAFCFATTESCQIPLRKERKGNNIHKNPKMDGVCGRFLLALLWMEIFFFCQMRS